MRAVFHAFTSRANALGPNELRLAGAVLLKSSVYHRNRLLFDNVLMVAADANNEDHAVWVDRIRCRRRGCITINARDSALNGDHAEFGLRFDVGHNMYRLR